MGSARLLRLAAILAFALLPAVGILFLGWDWREVMVLYWLENVGIGIAIVARMVRASVLNARDGSISTGGGPLVNFVLVYAVFTGVAGLFVFGIVGGAFDGRFGGSGGDSGSGADLASVMATLQSPAGALDWPSILVVTGVGLVLHVAVAFRAPASIRPRDSQLVTANQRMYILQAAIIGGGCLIALLGLPSLAALVLVAIHATVDVFAWLGTARPAAPHPSTARHLQPDEPDSELPS